MKSWKIILAIIVLIVSLVLLFDKLLTPQPIQIVLPSGTEITTENSESFTLTETILLIVCSFLIGITSIYLFYNSDKSKPILVETARTEDKSNDVSESKPADTNNIIEDKFALVFPLLKEDERRLLMILKEANGEMLQNQLVLKLNLSKVKVTRLLHSMEQKNLIVKDRNGLTNNIKLVR